MADAQPIKPARPPITRTVEEWRKEKRTDPHLYAMAKYRHRWQHGPEVDPTRITEAEYDAALKGLAGLQLA